MGINIVANFVSPAYDISNLRPERINFRLGGLITSILSVLVCPWLFVASPQAITIFVSIFGCRPGTDVRHHRRRLLPGEAAGRSSSGSFTRMSPDGAFHYEGGWNRRAAAALALAGALSIGLALAGAYGAIANVGDWGWLIGAVAGAAIYRALAGRGEAAAARAG